MKTMLALLVLFLPLLAPAAEYEIKSGYIKLAAGHEVYAEYKEAAPGKPTFVLVNGLVYDLSRWNTMSDAFASQGYGVLRYYFRGQLNTLRRELQDGEPKFFRDGLSQENLATELSQLMAALKIEKGVIVGLSYGAGIAAEFGRRFPQKTEQLVLLAPLVISLDHYDPSGAWIQWNLNAVKIFWGPMWGAWAYDQYYNFIFRKYLSDRLSSDRIPAEMLDVSDAYKESLFHQVRALREFDLRNYRFPELKGRVHVLLASGEEEPALKDQFRAWKNFGAAQGSLIYLSPSWHAIPDASGAWASELLTALATKDSRLTAGQAYYSIPRMGWLSVQKAAIDSLEAKALAEPRDAAAASVQKQK